MDELPKKEGLALSQAESIVSTAIVRLKAGVTYIYISEQLAENIN